MDVGSAKSTIWFIFGVLVVLCHGFCALEKTVAPGFTALLK